MIANFILNSITDFFSSIAFYFVLAAFGIAAGFVIAFVGQRSLLAAGALCAAVLVAAQIFGALDRFSDKAAQAKIEQLEAENKRQAAKIAITEATNDELTDFLDKERIDAEKNAETIARLNKQIEAVENNPNCTLPKGFLDELENLR